MILHVACETYIKGVFHLNPLILDDLLNKKIVILL